MAFHGDLKSVPLGDVIQTLLQNDQTGTLKIQGPGFEKSIFCCPSGITILEPEILSKRRLGDILVSAKQASRNAVEKAALQTEKGQLLGQTLVSTGVIDQDLLDRVLRVQIEDELFHLFELNAGEFEFFEEAGAGSSIPADRGLPLFQVEGVLLEAARRMDEWLILRKYVGDLDVIMLPVNSLPAGSEPAVERVFKRINGKTTLRAISDSLLASPFEVSKIVAGLVEQGCVRTAEKHELLNLAHDLIDEGETTQAGCILKKLRPNLSKLILEEGDVSNLADLFYKVGDILTATNILLDKVRESKDKDLQEGGLPFLRQAHQIAPDDTRILSELAKVSDTLGDNDGKIQYLMSTVNIHANGERYNAAIKACEEILETDENNGFVVEKMPSLLMKAGNKQEAIEFLEIRAQKLGKRGDPQLLVKIYRELLKLDPSRREFTTLLRKAQRQATNKNRRFIHLAGIIIIGMGGVISWIINQPGHEKSDMDLVAYAAIQFAEGDVQGARDELLRIKAGLEDPDALDQANVLLSNIEIRLKQSDTFLVELRQKKYFDRLRGIQEHLSGGSADQALLGLKSLAKDFDTIDYRNSTQKEAARVTEAITEDLADLRKNMAEFTPPTVDDDILAAVERFKPLIPAEKAEALVSLATVLDLLNEDEVFADAITEELILNVEQAAKEVEAFLGVLAELEEQLERLHTLADLSLLYDEAKAAETSGQLDQALSLYTGLVERYGDGQLKEMFMEKQSRLQQFFDDTARVDELTLVGDHEAAYDLAHALLERHADNPAYHAFVRLPMLITSIPEGAKIRSEGRDLGLAPRVVQLQPGQILNLSLEMAGYERRLVVVDQEGGAIQRLALNRDTRFSVKLGGLVEGRPLMDDRGITVASRNGVLTLVDPETGDQLMKFKTGSLSGIPASVTSAHDRLYFNTLEGALFSLKPDSMALAAKKDLSAGTRCAPVAYGDGIITACLDGRVAAFSADLSETRWSVNVKDKVRVDPLLLQETLVLALASGELLFLEASSGKTLGRCHTGSEEVIGLAAAADQVVVCSADGWIRNFSAPTGRKRWETEVDGYIQVPPIFVAEGIFVAAHRQVLHLDPKDGKILEQFSGSEKITTPCVVQGGILCYGTEAGNLHYRRLAADQDEWIYHAEDSITATPIVTDRAIFITDRKGHLIAILR